MVDQDAQDINQMMSGTSDVLVSKPKKSMFIWIVLGCVVVGIGLGVVVYQQSIKPVPIVKTTPRPTAVSVATPVPTEMPITPLESPVPGEISVVQPLANTVTFPQTGKIRLFNDLNNSAMVFTIKIGTETKVLTLPSTPVTTANPMNFTDSTFTVTAGTTGTVVANLGTATGPKMGGWLLPKTGNKCGSDINKSMDVTAKLSFVQSHLATGKTTFATQCWSDEIVPGDASSYDFNDFFIVWSYAPDTNTSPSPSASSVASSSPTPSPSPSRAASPTPTPSPSRAASPSPSNTPAGGTATTPTPSPRAAMPDTSGGTPVTGVFEVTVGTISVGLIFLLLGLFGLLAL